MPGKTRHFGLAYFDFKDRLDSAVSVKLERDRFLTIDDQLYGLFHIFGNGIVKGFRVTRSQGLNGRQALSVEPGVIFCRNRSFESTETEIIENIPANGEIYVFADISSPSPGSKSLTIYVSGSGSDTNAIRLARITMTNGTVGVIDSSFRHEISFRRIIENEVSNHKHNGTVSKIDLLKEVKNSLPGARIGQLDASKIKNGTLARERIPRLNHNELKNIGIVSHSGLETLARSLQNINRQLLGEVSSVNMMKHSLMLKRKFPEETDNTVNMITFIPGLTPNSAIDFSNSSSNIDLSSQCISGRFLSGGRQVSVKYVDNQALSSYVEKSNCSINFDSVFLNSNVVVSGASVQFKDSFENATGDDRPFPGVTADPVPVESKIAVRSNAYNYVDGIFSAKFTSGKKDKSVYTRSVTTQKDWTSFNRLYLSIKCFTSPHPPVLFYLSNVAPSGSVEYSEKIQLLSEDEVTSGFKNIEIDITNYAKNNIAKLVFEVTDSTPEFSFFVDDIKTAVVSTEASEIVYSESGYIIYRYAAPSQVVLETINFESVSDNGTSVECRYRTGSNIIDLLNSSFSNKIIPEEVIQVPCTHIEIKFLLKSNVALNSTPVLKSMTIIIVIQGGQRRIEVNSLDDWNLGSYSNLEVFQETPGSNDNGIRLKGPLENNHIIYSSDNHIQQIKNALPNIPPLMSNISIFGFDGSSLLSSPQQVASFTYGNPLFGIDQATSVKRLENRNYLICDTYNNRVLEIDRSGQLVLGFGGSYVTENTTQQDPIPLCVNLNINTRVMQICFDQDLNRENISILGRVKIILGNSEILIDENDLFVEENSPNNCVQILLSLPKTQIIISATSQIFIKIDPKLLGEDVVFNTTSPVFSFAYSLSGLKLTKFNFTYIKNIFHPVSAIQYSENSWIIGNSLVNFDRIRAGYREDIDEFFIPISTDFEFYIIANLSDEIMQKNPKVTFLNIQSDEYEYIPVDITSGSNTTFADLPEVTAQSSLSSKVKVNPAAAMVDKDFVFTFKIKVEVKNPITNEYVSVPGSPFSLEKRVHIIPVSTLSGSTPPPELPSVFRIDTQTRQTDFAYGNISEFTFSDFTIGSISKLVDNSLLIGGIKMLPEDLQFPYEAPNDDGFRFQAFTMLKNYRGKVIKIDPEDGSVSFNYDSPDGLYVSDCSLTSQNEILVAESSILQNAGRTIKIDGFGNINFLLSNSQFSIINHARESGQGNILIST